MLQYFILKNELQNTLEIKTYVMNVLSCKHLMVLASLLPLLAMVSLGCLYNLWFCLPTGLCNFIFSWHTNISLFSVFLLQVCMFGKLPLGITWLNLQISSLRNRNHLSEFVHRITLFSSQIFP